MLIERFVESGSPGIECLSTKVSENSPYRIGAHAGDFGDVTYPWLLGAAELCERQALQERPKLFGLQVLVRNFLGKVVHIVQLVSPT